MHKKHDKIKHAMNIYNSKKIKSANSSNVIGKFKKYISTYIIRIYILQCTEHTVITS